MTSRSRNLRLGLVSHDGASWIAGALYVQTVIRAMESLPKEYRPEMRLWLRRGTEAGVYANHQHLVKGAHVYDAMSHSSLRQVIKNHRRSLLRHQRFSRSLASHASRAGEELIFPCTQSLGPDAEVPWIGWIPDFQHRHLPELFSDDTRQKRDERYAQIIAEADHVVVSSEAARHDIMKFYGASPEDVSLYRFRTWPDPAWFEGQPELVAEKHGLPEKFLMFPSQFWKHKEHLTLIEAVARLKSSGIEVCLVLTGNDRDYRHPDYAPMVHDRIASRGLSDQIRYLGLLPRFEQVQLMRRCAAIVQPSRFEGWSMLVEDCRALGKTMVLSDIPVHREQAYAMATYFKLGDAGDLTKVLGRLWPTLQPGPDAGVEGRARKENENLTVKNGQQLLSVFEKAVDAHGKRKR